MEVGEVNHQPAGNYYKELCVVCEKNKAQGIHLYTSFICSECEREMISTETNDPKYRYYLKQLRKAAEPQILS
ncbi:sigma factor G inhibitor Gin [Neobacillus piezotolerans]|uniref:Sigma factor G inhibitor Gin n=1 Tax=Neobacillus piezotolerans TaxID=2259171 RepID=A0A3D8GKH4_9BACI|nr:sigma factor G inhibitor Gin [Neobacillus piezotolerans]RDU34822.1 sigma factor G inhibitor Gin [Neobacillus piezotolerans]